MYGRSDQGLMEPSRSLSEKLSEKHRLVKTLPLTVPRFCSSFTLQYRGLRR